MPEKQIEFYCASCHEPHDMNEYSQDKIRGKDAYVSECPKCNTRMCTYKANVIYKETEHIQCPHCLKEIPKEDVCPRCDSEINAEE